MTQQSKSHDEKPLILIAEDNDSNYALISIILKEDYNIIRVANVVETVKLLEHKHPRVILIDLNAPQIGLEVTRKIRELDKKLPIIALTTFASDSDKKQAMKAGCNGFLTKPVNAEELRMMIKCYIK